MEKKVYRIVERQTYMKFVKKNDCYDPPKVSYNFISKIFDTKEEAQSYIKFKELNEFPFGNPLGAHYEKIEDNLFKLTYEGDKTFRYLSYEICEFTVPAIEKIFKI